MLDADTAGGVILRYKHILQATWSDGPWAVTATQNWYNGYQTGVRQVDGETQLRRAISSSTICASRTPASRT